MNSFKKIISFSLLTIVTMPIVLCSYFLWQQHGIKEEMEEQLEAKNLTTIKVHKNSIQWIEDDKEILVNNQMFDVKSIEQNNDTLIITGLFDYAEKEIKQKLSSLLNKKNTTHNPLQKIIDSFSQQLFYFTTKDDLQFIFSAIIKKSEVIFTEKILITQLEVTTPPPNGLTEL
jgi:hypothetical protein